MVSIILSCHNGERFLKEAMTSVLKQDYQDIELIFVNDGSTDRSLEIAEKFAGEDNRVSIYTIQNTGLNAARNYGAKCSSEKSDALLFFDADDILDKRMIGTLYTELMHQENIGAVYCTFNTIDEDGSILKKNISSRRLIPTKFWVRSIPESEKFTPFLSIYGWTLMVEACTMIRKELFFRYGGWDEQHFPKGKTFGESMPLFSEIALNHKVAFINHSFYYYRKHSNQITAAVHNMKNIQKKIDGIMVEKSCDVPSKAVQVNNAIWFVNYRLPLYIYIHGSLKHHLRYNPLSAIRHLIESSIKYLYSLLLFNSFLIKKSQSRS